MNVNLLIPERCYSEKEPSLLKCQKCEVDDLKLVRGGNTPASCDYLMCNNCKTKVAGYGIERLTATWNDMQKVRIKL